MSPPSSVKPEEMRHHCGASLLLSSALREPATSLRSPQPLAELLCRRRKITLLCLCLPPASPAAAPSAARTLPEPEGWLSPALLSPRCRPHPWCSGRGLGTSTRNGGFPAPITLPSDATNKNPVWWRFGQALLFLSRGSKQGMIQERGSRAKAPGNRSCFLCRARRDTGVERAQTVPVPNPRK